MFVFSLVLLWGINTFTDNAPMFINFVRGCSIVVAISVVAYALYSLRGSKTVKPEQVETVE
ncbi:hypothetical protein L1D31_11030 [Vibrio sp. Isolate23]|nr:hypothetical protein [Vibrio sp. Isolate23]MCG9683108.1 hypothetical protein [Vibrio sp. Isolate23]